MESSVYDVLGKSAVTDAVHRLRDFVLGRMYEGDTALSIDEADSAFVRRMVFGLSGSDEAFVSKNKKSDWA